MTFVFTKTKNKNFRRNKKGDVTSNSRPKPGVEEDLGLKEGTRDSVGMSVTGGTTRVYENCVGTSL